MKHVIYFILFILYTIGIFFINQIELLVGAFLFHLILLFCFKIKVRKVITNILQLLPFILFTGLSNFLLTDAKEASLVTIKLLLVCNITFLFSQILTVGELSNVIEKLLFPLTFFGINTQEIGIMISIAITFIPILKKELQELTLSLKVKGHKLTIRAIPFLLKPFFMKLMEKINQLVISLRAKGFQDE